MYKVEQRESLFISKEHQQHHRTGYSSQDTGWRGGGGGHATGVSPGEEGGTQTGAEGVGQCTP